MIRSKIKGPVSEERLWKWKGLDKFLGKYDDLVAIGTEEEEGIKKIKCLAKDHIASYQGSGKNPQPFTEESGSQPWFPF